MRLYTPEEVWEDLRQFERYELTMPPADIQKLRFTKTWSEYYGTPVRELDPVNVKKNVLDRIEYFLARANHIVPQTDRYPRSGFRFTVYAIDGEIKAPWDVKLKFVFETNGLETFLSTMKSKLIPQNKGLYYIDAKHRVVKLLVCRPGVIPEVNN